VVKEVLETKTVPDQLIISDIGFNDNFRKLFSLFRKNRDNSCKIFWFDHHLVDRKNKKELKNILDLYLNDPTRCSAEIIKDYYLPDDPIARKIADFSRDIDFHTRKYTAASNLQSIIAYHRGHQSNDVKKCIVDLLSKGIFENDWYNTQLIPIKEWEEKQTKFAIGNMEILNIRTFGKICISFAEMGGGKLVSILKENSTDIKTFIGIDTRYNEVVIHSNYINCRELARDFKGGGHKNRAGFKYEEIFTAGHELSNKFIQNIKKSIMKYQIKEKI
jgi:oligoribonuclease NrnB/cAMP/cGMP phosphodiesterase (DHH superfamily)